VVLFFFVWQEAFSLCFPTPLESFDESVKIHRSVVRSQSKSRPPSEKDLQTISYSGAKY
jgi:hypothetical protein